MDVSGIPNMGFGGSPAPFAPGGSFGTWSADQINQSMGMGPGGAGAQNQAGLNNIFNNFGKQTDYYSNLGASFGRQTGGFGGYGGNNDPFSQVGGGGYPAGQVTSQPIPDIPWSDPFGGSKGGGSLWGSGTGAAPDSANYTTHDAWQRDFDAFLSGGSTATDYYGSQLTNPNSNAFQGGGWNPAPQVPMPQPRPPTANLNPGAAIPSGGGGGGGAPAYPMWGANQGQPDYNGDMWGGNSGYKAGGGFAPPDSANYTTHDAWQRDYDAYTSGGPKYGFPFGGEPSASPGPAVPPASPFFGGSGSRDQLAKIFRDSMSPQGPPIQAPQAPGSFPPIQSGGGLNRPWGFGGQTSPGSPYFTTGVEGAGIDGWGAGGPAGSKLYEPVSSAGG